MAYSEAYFTARESWRDWRIEAEYLMNLARVTRGARVLEMGCGGGGVLRMLRARNALPFGVDTLDVALELARSRNDLPGHLDVTQIGDDGVLPFRDHVFDALIGQHVVEHIDDLAAALREWSRVLKPGGRVALATPNARYPDPAHFADADHAHVYALAELRDAFTRAGWRVETGITIFPYFSRVRALRALGVIVHRVFIRAPYFATRGRTILLAATFP
ncbi:MAG: class I SAM-dependent methyltransferase [Chloroflexi bacterium]|nr:class I SAM-dependent methyltransferase [Chloroflexota bacterium]